MTYWMTSLIASSRRATGRRRTCDREVVNVTLSKFWEELLGIHALLFATALAYEQTCYFLASRAAGDDAPAGRSELNMSALTFHLPSACFFQTSQYLPLSLVPSFIVIS